MYIDIEIYKGDDNIFVAACPELNLFTHAETQDKAVEKLKENILHFLENSKNPGDPGENAEFNVRFYPSRRPRTH